MSPLIKGSSLLLIIVTVLALSVESCVDHNIETPLVDCTDSKPVSFSTDVKPIITANCAIQGDGGCHNGGNGPDLNWTVFEKFQSHSSDVQDRITRPAGAVGHMPKIGSITDDQIKLIYCWVAQGAKNN